MTEIIAVVIGVSIGFLVSATPLARKASEYVISSAKNAIFHQYEASSENKSS